MGTLRTVYALSGVPGAGSADGERCCSDDCAEGGWGAESCAGVAVGHIFEATRQ